MILKSLLTKSYMISNTQIKKAFGIDGQQFEADKIPKALDKKDLDSLKEGPLTKKLIKMRTDDLAEFIGDPNKVIQLPSILSKLKVEAVKQTHDFVVGLIQLDNNSWVAVFGDVSEKKLYS